MSQTRQKTQTGLAMVTKKFLITLFALWGTLFALFTLFIELRADSLVCFLEWLCFWNIIICQKCTQMKNNWDFHNKCNGVRTHEDTLATARMQIAAREIVLWTTPSEPPKALQASECSELLDPMRASCLILAQHQPGKFKQWWLDNLFKHQLSVVNGALTWT